MTDPVQTAAVVSNASASNWPVILDWLRLGASIIVPFAAVWFATTRAKINALFVLNQTTEEKAARVLKALKYEIQVDIGLLLVPTITVSNALSHSTRTFPIMEYIRFERELRRDVYKECVQYMGVYENEGPLIVELYGELQSLRDSFNLLHKTVESYSEIEDEFFDRSLEENLHHRIAVHIENIAELYEKLFGELFKTLVALKKHGMAIREHAG